MNFLRDETSLKRLMFLAGAGGGSLSEYEVEGNPAVFNTNVAKNLKGLVVPFTPVQDLTYGAPYPAGGGKNLLPIEKSSETVSGVTFTVNSDGTVNANGTATSDITFTLKSGLNLPAGTYILSGCPSGGSEATYRLFGTNIGSDIGSGIQKQFSEAFSTTVRIAIKSGTVINNQTYYPMIRRSTESATFAPYSNICPIYGYTGINIKRTGINIWDGIVETGTINNQTGELTPHNSLKRSVNPIVVKQGESFYVNSRKGVLLYWYDANMKYLGYLDNVGTLNNEITVPANASIMRIRLFSNYTDYEIGDVSINYPVTKTDSYDYVGTTIPITFPAVGKNLLDKNSYKGINNGNIKWGAGLNANPDGSLVLEEGTYTVSASSSATGWYIDGYDGTRLKTVYNNTNATFTVPSTQAISIMFYKTNVTQADFLSYNYQLESGSSATSYEPFNNTIYGGELDVLTGELTVDWEGITLDGTQTISLVNWKPSNVAVGWVYPYTLTNAIIGSGTAVQPIISDKFKAIPYNSMGTSNEIGIALANAKPYGISIKQADTSLTTASLINAYLAQNPIQVVYKLETPKTYQLTPQQVSTLIGDNVIFSDTNGENTIKYLKKG